MHCSERLQSMFKIRQQKAALRVALYVLQKNGFDRPKKKHVLNFIRLKRLLQFPPEELVKRNDEDTDEIWANSIAWKRKDLFGGGEVDSPEYGKWRLTAAGIQAIEEKKPNWSKCNDPDEREAFLKKFDYCTPELLDWMFKIANGDDLTLKATNA